MLAEYLRGEGHGALLTREPGGTSIGDKIRAILMSLENTEMTPEAEFLLFSASRAQHVREVIVPHLERGGVVVCDRFYDSSLAYQGYGHQLSLPALQEVTQFATGGLRPEFSLLLDLSVEEGLRRREQGGSWNRLDAYDLEFHRRVRQGYLELAADEPERWHVVDASLDEGQVQSQIRRAVDARLRRE
jgi:dTMP kinase